MLAVLTFLWFHIRYDDALAMATTRVFLVVGNCSVDHVDMRCPLTNGRLLYACSYRRDRLQKKRKLRSQHMKMLQQVLRSSSDSGGSTHKGGSANAEGLSQATVYERILTPKNGRRHMGAVAFVVTDLEHSTAMSNTDGVAFRELQILHDNVRWGHDDTVLCCKHASLLRVLYLFSVVHVPCCVPCAWQSP